MLYAYPQNIWDNYFTLYFFPSYFKAWPLQGFEHGQAMPASKSPQEFANKACQKVEMLDHPHCPSRPLLYLSILFLVFCGTK